MKIFWRTGLTFIFFLVLLIAYTTLRSGKNRQDSAQRNLVVLEVPRHLIKNIFVENSHGKFKFRKVGPNWQILEPRNFSMEPNRAASMLNALSQLKATSVVWRRPSSEEQKTAGLGKPTATIEFTANKKKYALQIGMLHPLGDEYYVKGGTKPTIYAVRKWLVEVFLKNLTEFRRRQVFPHRSDSIGGLRIESKTLGTLLLKRKDSTSPWKLTKPLQGPADPEKVSALLSKLQTLRAETFVADDVQDFSSYGLEKPSAFVHMDWVDGSPGAGIAFGEWVDTKQESEFSQYYLRFLPGYSVFATGSTLRKDLDSAINDWRDPLVYRFDPNTIDAVKMDFRGVQITGYKDGHGNWRTKGLSDLYAHPEMMSFLRAAAKLEISQFLPTAEKKPTKSQITPSQFQLSRADGSETVITMGRSRKGEHLFHTNHGPAAYWAKSTHLMKTLEKLRDLVQNTGSVPFQPSESSVQ